MSYELGPCRPEELPDLISLVNRVFRSRRPGDMGAEYPLVFHPDNAENLMVARHEGRIVAHVGLCIRDATILGAPVRVVSIGAVGTDPDHRGHGTASQLMALARERGRDQGASLMLISGGRGLYHRLGYVEVGEFHGYAIAAGDGDPSLSAALYTPDDFSALTRLHQGEAVRFLRPVADWLKLLHAGMLMNQPADLWLIRHDGEAVAYAAVQRPGESADGLRAPARVRELAGSRAALAGILPRLARDYGSPHADVVTWTSDHEWAYQAAARGWKRTTVAFPGTLGVIDSERFLAAVSPLLAERIPELRLEPRGEGALVEAGGESAVLETRGQLTALLFGGETDEARALPPLPAFIQEAVNRALPLPLPWYGFNYV